MATYLSVGKPQIPIAISRARNASISAGEWIFVPVMSPSIGVTGQMFFLLLRVLESIGEGLVVSSCIGEEWLRGCCSSSRSMEKREGLDSRRGRGDSVA